MKHTRSAVAIARRSRRIVSPRWVGAILPVREAAQRLIELWGRRNLAKVLDVARSESPALTTEQPDRQPAEL